MDDLNGLRPLTAVQGFESPYGAPIKSMISWPCSIRTRSTTSVSSSTSSGTSPTTRPCSMPRSKFADASLPGVSRKHRRVVDASERHVEVLHPCSVDVRNQFTDTQRDELQLRPRDLAEERSIAILLTLFTLLGASVTGYVLLVAAR